MLAERGVEVTLDRLVAILEESMNSEEERECRQCGNAFMGMCYACLVLKIQEDL